MRRATTASMIAVFCVLISVQLGAAEPGAAIGSTLTGVIV